MNNLYYKEYSRLAYKRAIYSALQRHLMEYMSTESSGAVRQLDCEEVLAADRFVPEEAFHDLLDTLREEEEKVKVEMAAFEVRRKTRGTSTEPEDPQDNGGT